MEGRCTRYQECDSFKRKGCDGCDGCGFQHFDTILRAHGEKKALKFLGKEYFTLCSKGRSGRGGRKALDEPIRKLFKDRLPKARELLSSDRKDELTINSGKVVFEIKSDGAFEVSGKHVFYEVKGYGDNTNDVLSAITAAQLLKMGSKYKNSLYYYIGISSGKKGNKGLERKHFHDPKRTKIYPYVKWAESNDFLKFYGIVDIEDLLREVRETTENTGTS